MIKNSSKEYVKELIVSKQYLENKPLNQIVFEGIRNAIIQGRIPVGERINEKEYSIILNISRTPIREALRRLEEEGLVEYIPNYGVIVKKITIEDAEEIFEIRKLLDALAIASAMKKMTEKEFEILENSLLMAEKADRVGDSTKHIECSKEFNELIYEFSGMMRVKSIVIKLREYIERFRKISLTNEVRRRKALDDHWKMYYLMKKGKEEELVELTKNHLMRAKKYILEEMKKLEEETETNGDKIQKAK